MGRRGKVLEIEVTPYHILDIMADKHYPFHFLLRFKIALETGSSFKNRIFAKIYGDNPELLYTDALDEVRTQLGLQQSSAAQIKFTSTSAAMQVVLEACSSWITEKTGRDPEFEIFQNTVKSARTQMQYYGHYKKDSQENSTKGEL